MWLKRTDESWVFEYLTKEEETIELKNILMYAMREAEKICDVFFELDPTKWLIEEMRLKNKLTEEMGKALWVDLYKQEIARLFFKYKK